MVYILSFISMIATIIRLVMATQHSIDDEPKESIQNRLNYIYWTVVEVMSAILCANLPAMRALIRQVKKNIGIPSVFSASSKSQNSHNQPPSKVSQDSYKPEENMSLHSLRIGDQHNFPYDNNHYSFRPGPDNGTSGNFKSIHITSDLHSLPIMKN